MTASTPFMCSRITPIPSRHSGSCSPTGAACPRYSLRDQSALTSLLPLAPNAISYNFAIKAILDATYASASIRSRRLRALAQPPRTDNASNL
jgi:hypothetical protein